VEELLAIFSVVVLLPAIIFHHVTKIKEAKYRAQEGAGDGLRASELQRLIREAVEEAVEPLHARLDALEGPPPRVAEPRLDPAVLAGALDTDLDAESEAAAVRHRTRS
jgi:hypothetical protein